MCLILLAWRAHPEFPLVVAANRDERHDRPSEAARFWDDAPELLAGRDLEQSGTWLGITRGGKFAAVTNYREFPAAAEGDASRGHLTRTFLQNGAQAGEYVAHAAAQGGAYRGFNLLVADRDELWWTSNRGAGSRRLAPGVYGLSNHLLDTPWTKVRRGKGWLAEALRAGPSVDALLEPLGDASYAPDAELPDTGVGLERERVLSAAKIVSPEYGTRCSTVLLVATNGRVRFAERAYDARGIAQETVRYEFGLASA